jgi:hypothetical protein
MAPLIVLAYVRLFKIAEVGLVEKMFIIYNCNQLLTYAVKL